MDCVLSIVNLSGMQCKIDFSKYDEVFSLPGLGFQIFTVQYGLLITNPVIVKCQL